MALYKISSSRVNNIDADQYTGSVVEQGLIWYDPDDGLLRLYNGNQGGYIINSGGSGGNPIEVDYNGNVVTSDLRSLNFTGNGVSVTGNSGNITVDIVKTPTNIIELGNSNVQVWPDGNVTISIRGNANAAVFSNPVAVFDNLIVTGLETAGNLNANVISATGNITGGNVSAINYTGTTVSVTGNVTGGGLVGTLYTNSIINTGSNATGNIGSATTYFNTVFARATSAQYADLAEKYTADADYEPGTVVVFGGSAEVTASNKDADKCVVGVVSTNPSYIMNAGLESQHVVTVALIGRVPTKVIGPVQRGDFLVSAPNGHAQACATPAIGTVIGKAIENFTGDVGVIEILVNNH